MFPSIPIWGSNLNVEYEPQPVSSNFKQQFLNLFHSKLQPTHINFSREHLIVYNLISSFRLHGTMHCADKVVLARQEKLLSKKFVDGRKMKLMSGKGSRFLFTSFEGSFNFRSTWCLRKFNSEKFLSVSWIFLSKSCLASADVSGNVKTWTFLMRFQFS